MRSGSSAGRCGGSTIASDSGPKPTTRRDGGLASKSRTTELQSSRRWPAVPEKRSARCTATARSRRRARARAGRRAAETGTPRTGAGARESGQRGEDDRRHGESEQRAARRRPQGDRGAGERQPRGREGGRALACPPARDRPAGGDRQQPNQRLGEEERVTLSGGRPPLPIDLPAQRIESGPLHEGVGDQRAGRGEPRGLAALPARDRAQARRQDEEEDEQRELAGEPEEARRGSEEAAQRVDRGHRRDELRGARGERPAHQGRGQTSAQRRRCRSARSALASAASAIAPSARTCSTRKRSASGPSSP